MINKQHNQEEQDPLLPSGEWQGFYCYKNESAQHKMQIELHFNQGKVSGAGVDNVAPFTWSGKYDLVDYKLFMIKKYTTHTVDYYGNIDENGIWGTWKILHDFGNIPPHFVNIIMETLGSDTTGGFHIWPKKNNTSFMHSSFADAVESNILKELYTEELVS